MDTMNWFDIVVIVLILITLIKGFFSGLVMQVATLAGLILGAIFAGKLSELIAPELIKLTDASPHIIGPLSYIIAFIAIIVILFLAGKMIESFMDALAMNTLNRLAGAVFCAAKWIILTSILLNLIVEFDQDKKIIKEDVRSQSYTYPLISEVAKTVIPYLRFDWIK
ncbi:membrane protein required for colicin V production [Dysgonomonas hofstadii]|uniref:Membrane protein required for colicin V production n=1 Tax=Dysgonomonas hofstadii TaxID=637886 RepID=A0A840CMH8_9BACT|nr:CvpA family protein [Dysgonomonas hofstadii]MBB4037190.1 membrane protein required for colicin V production [Dysgonomonas hofstadii]